MTRFPAFILAVLVLPAVAEEASVVLPEKYQAVVERYPFGQPPEGFDPLSATPQRYEETGEAGAAEPEIPLTQQQEALQRSVVATALVFDRTTGNPWLGFSDLSNPKAPQSHYVQLGMSEDGWTVVDVDMNRKTAKLSKDDVEIEVVVGARKEPEKPAPGGGAGGRRLGGGTTMAGGTSGRSPLLGQPQQQRADQPATLQSMRQRRLERESAQRQLLEAERKANQEAVEETRRLLAENERKAKEREEDDSRRAQERAEREAERAAEREEYNQRVKNLAAQLEAQMVENRRKRLEEGNANAEE